MKEVIDFDRLRDITDGDEDLERELVELFIETAQRCLARLEKVASQEIEFEYWSDLCHELKGASANIGAKTLKKACAEAELVDEGSDEMEGYLGEIRQAYEEVEETLSDLM